MGGVQGGRHLLPQEAGRPCGLDQDRRGRAGQGPDDRDRDGGGQDLEDSLAGGQDEDVWELTKEAGVLLGKGGYYGNVFRIKPPMCITKEDVDFTVDALEQAVRKIEAEL